ncbi:MAG: transposase [Acidobacteria bacterium]|nr:transposase [Acidobacteriota bacterium]
MIHEKRKKVVFKHYDQNQPMLLPPSLDDLVPANHPVRVVNEVIERIDIGVLELGYKGGGASSYHPRLLLKVLVYAYLRNIYSSRKIEQALHENVHFCGSPATRGRTTTRWRTFGRSG